MLSVPGSTPSSCIRSANISVPTTEAALLRVTVESISPKAAIAGERERVDREARDEQDEPVAAETFVPGERRQRVEAPGDAAGDEADEAHREDDRERVA